MEAGAFEERVDASHFGQGFDPGERAGCAACANEVGGEAGAAVAGVDDDSGEADDLSVDGGEKLLGPAAGELEEAVASGEGNGGRGEDADADGLVVQAGIGLPEEGDELNEARGVAAIVPASKVRPV